LLKISQSDWRIIFQTTGMRQHNLQPGRWRIAALFFRPPDKILAPMLTRRIK
jgi:hypothetical protein